MAGALLLAGAAQNDLHYTSTDTLSHPDLAAKWRRPFTPATLAADGRLLTPASAECWTSDLTLAEFWAMVVMACDDEVISAQILIDTVTDDSDLDCISQTERHLLYFACTRAREQCWGAAWTRRRIF